MMTTTQLLILVLLAVLVGALVPVLVQLRRTLRSAELFFELTSTRLPRTLADIEEAMARLNRFGDTIEKGLAPLSPMLQTAREVAGTIDRARGRMRTLAAVGGALGPAFLAGVRAFFSFAEPRAGEPAAVTTRDDREEIATPLGGTAATAAGAARGGEEVSRT